MPFTSFRPHYCKLTQYTPQQLHLCLLKTTCLNVGDVFAKLRHAALLRQD